MTMNDEQRTLVEDNARLVTSVIMKYFPNCIMDEEIVSCGYMGLCKAALKWDVTRGQFSTFAWWCIRNEIRREFRDRQKRTSVEIIPLDCPIGDGNITVEEALDDGTRIDIEEELFRNLLTEEEERVYQLRREGYTINDIITTTGFERSKVRSILRKIRKKYLKDR